MIEYGKAYNILARFCQSALPLFADRWSRWPDAATACRIQAALRNKMDSCLFAMWPVDIQADIRQIYIQLGGEIK